MLPLAVATGNLQHISRTLLVMWHSRLRSRPLLTIKKPAMLLVPARAADRRSVNCLEHLYQLLDHDVAMHGKSSSLPKTCVFDSMAPLLRGALHTGDPQILC